MKKQITSKIKNMLKKPYSLKLIGKGIEKECYIVSGESCENIVVLKYYRNYISNYDLIKNYFINSVCNKNLLKKGVKIPKIYRFFIKDDEFYEVQEKAKGEVLFVSSFLAKVKKIINNSCSFEEAEDKINKYFNLIVQNNQKRFDELLNAPSEHFQILIKSLHNIVKEYGYNVFDPHSENFLYSKENGFQIIDLNYEFRIQNDKIFQNTTKENCKREQEIIEDTCKVFFHPFIFASYDVLSDWAGTEDIDYEPSEDYKKEFKNLTKRLIDELIIFGIPKEVVFKTFEDEYLGYSFTKEEFNEIINLKSNKKGKTR